MKLRHTAWNSEDDEQVETYYPPAIFRPQPRWFSDLWVELKTEDEFVENLLREIYVALQNNSPKLGCDGDTLVVGEDHGLEDGRPGSVFKTHI